MRTTTFWVTMCLVAGAAAVSRGQTTDVRPDQRRLVAAGDARELMEISTAQGQPVRVIEAQPLVGNAHAMVKPNPKPLQDTGLAQTPRTSQTSVVTRAAISPAVATTVTPVTSASPSVSDQPFTTLNQSEVKIQNADKPLWVSGPARTSDEDYRDGYRNGYRTGYDDGTWDARPRYVYQPAPVVYAPPPVVYCYPPAPPVWSTTTIIYRGGHWGGAYSYHSGWYGRPHCGPRYHRGSGFGFGLSLRF
ncbi:MAG: hypothetical protein IT440_08505 [Phycisphaeraceae bacterium]|nr:hypothetical protein [Phycisphaeraceae bacterium]